MRRDSKVFVPSSGGNIHQAAAKLSELSALRSHKRRDVDAFIKQRQDGGESTQAPISRAEVAAASNAASRYSSQDEGDPSSTNLYIAGVAPTVTEQRLQTLFEEFGEIYSIKIMWPRTGEERARQRNIGFVSFWRRCDAAAAKQALHSRELDGMCIRWGQAISKLARGIGDKTRVKPVPVSALSAAVSDPADVSTDVSSDVSTVLAPVIYSAAEDGPANVTNALLAVASVGESTAGTVVVEAAAQPLASDAPPPEMQEGDSSLAVVEPRSKERRYLIERTAR
jgi:RNA recognition motif. (a.k.a. RRM, RBD, or RNP domain)